ncbi:hypothetical protein NL676_029774 [Syzygium grande]|nr:hypothetical protein NL676_029774 [Syzygium grande]
MMNSICLNQGTALKTEECLVLYVRGISMGVGKKSLNRGHMCGWSLIPQMMLKQPVLLGCALVADESKEPFIWLFETWLGAMSGCHPNSIIADHDDSILQAIAQVFPSRSHQFSMWQIKTKECEHLGPLSSDCKYEYEKCVYQSHTVGEFHAACNALLSNYGLRENAWLKEMYEKPENWIPLYLRGTFLLEFPLMEV